MTFLRTVEEGPTDRSYGVHVAGLAGVPEPVVGRARDVLDRLRSERAIEAKGGGDGDPVQAVFDLSSGQFREDRSAASDSGGVDADSDTDATPGPEAEAEAVLEELRGTDVEATAPVELLSKVRAWQRRLEDE